MARCREASIASFGMSMLSIGSCFDNTLSIYGKHVPDKTCIVQFCAPFFVMTADTISENLRVLDRTA